MKIEKTYATALFQNVANVVFECIILVTRKLELLNGVRGRFRRLWLSGGSTVRMRLGGGCLLWARATGQSCRVARVCTRSGEDWVR